MAENGSTIEVGSSIYSWSWSDADAELLRADTDSVVDLRRVSSFGVSYGSGARTYTIRATEGGLIDLSGLGTLTGPGEDDWLELNITTGGRILLGSLQQASGRVRFDIRVPTFELPKLGQASATEFLLGTNVVATLPQLLRLESGRVSLDPGAHLEPSALLSISDTSITVSDGASIDAPQLTSMHNVPLTLSGSGAFIATNLAAYRDSYIPVHPGRDFRPGMLTDVDASRIDVYQGERFAVSATSYRTWDDWRWSPTL
ncbi:MAG TPA: hypothetical protein P5525_24345, partial [Candidatus Paceibacterota bacterium]|nr:hypothetical protein [Candidatus Paceibacterota bacterium]